MEIAKLDIGQVTFGITHYLRNDDLFACVQSIRRRWPNALIDTDDTEGNVSASRNRLIARCGTPWFFMMEEDMRIRRDTNVDAMFRVLQHRPDLLGVGGAINEPLKGTRCLAAQYRRTARHLVIEDSRDQQATPAGDPFVLCSLIYNAGLFRTDLLRQYQWDERLELAEHYEFYWRIQQAGVHRVAVCCSIIDHLNSRPSKEYNDARKRIRLFRNAERKAIGRRLIRNYTESALQHSKRFRAVVVGPDARECKAATKHLPGVFCASPTVRRLIARLPGHDRWKMALRGNDEWKLYCGDHRRALLVANYFAANRCLLLYMPPKGRGDYAKYLPTLLKAWPFSVLEIKT